MNFLENHIEALIFCASEPITLNTIRECLIEMLDAYIPDEDIEQALEKLLQKYENENFAFKIYQVAQGYQFLTKSDYHTSIAVLLKHISKKSLSKSALETMAIIAYRQPIAKAEIEKIRGVGSDYALQKLLDKGLVAIQGKSEGPGRPLLYGTGDKFMEYFGLNSLDELPQPRDFAVNEGETPTESVEPA
ncbi:MAG: SMC-Scp complex subunit ScpB [Microscillaceae bacterium]|nr:SMC-Scp complex subunit ScpB [Microscillaceae bacterium]